MQLMQTSHATTACLLTDYAFVNHVFRPSAGRKDAISISLYARYARYHMRILHMRLTEQWNKPLVNSRSGQSLLPRSLVALTLGTTPQDKSIAYAAFDGSEQRCRADDWAEQGDSEERINRRTSRWERDNSCELWDVFVYGNSHGVFNRPLPPGALPHGLRFLHFAAHFNQPLQVGSIPDTVVVLQFGRNFDRGRPPACFAHSPRVR